MYVSVRSQAQADPQLASLSPIGLHKSSLAVRPIAAAARKCGAPGIVECNCQVAAQLADGRCAAPSRLILVAIMGALCDGQDSIEVRYPPYLRVLPPP
jgi:hypothetical protein